LVRESNLPKWRDLQLAFRRLEARGEIRGGRFVDGFLGEQFALPVAVESLRATRKLPPTGELVTISAADPLNLVGVVVPGERIPTLLPDDQPKQLRIERQIGCCIVPSCYEFGTRFPTGIGLFNRHL